MNIQICAVTAESLKTAANILRGGGLVAFPTETVYGLGANALDGKAVTKIYEAKGRPSFNPLIIHVQDAREAWLYAQADDRAKILAERFWPGPLTMILPRVPGCGISDLCSAGLPSLAVRVPASLGARQLLSAAGVPLAAPSANKSGEVSPTSPVHVAQSLGKAVDLILADGPCKVGLESTVIDLTGDVAAILRPGAITAEDLSAALGVRVAYASGDHDAPKSPGLLLKHYAPSVPVRLGAIDLEPGEALLAFGQVRFMGIRGGGKAGDLPEESLKNLSETGDLFEAASNLFAMLRALDRPEHKAIAVMHIPEAGIGAAINDRLRRAAAR